MRRPPQGNREFGSSSEVGNAGCFAIAFQASNVLMLSNVPVVLGETQRKVSPAFLAC